MYEVIYTGQFKKSLRLCVRRGLDIQAFKQQRNRRSLSVIARERRFFLLLGVGNLTVRLSYR